MPPAPQFADLDIHVRARTERGYPVKIVLNAVQSLGDGFLDPACLPQDFTIDPQAAGAQLFDCLLADASLRDAWQRARGQHPQRRIRLHIDAAAPELHALPWETLRDPGGSGSAAQDLAAAADTPLSRFPEQADPVPPALAQRPLRIAVAVAAPANLPTYRFTPIDLALELALLHDALDELPDVELVETPQPCTLAAVEQTLRGCHVLHFVGHGHFVESDRMAVLYLADEDNLVRVAPDHELAEMVRRLGADKPRLITLSSCQTAQQDPGDAFRGLAPALIRAGVPAVLAMQGRVPVHTARPFAAEFYGRLLQHGLLDLACNQARSHVISAHLPDPSLPVLFSRLPAGRLLAEAAPDARPVPQPPGAEHLFGRNAFQTQVVEELCAAGGHAPLALTALRGLPGVGKTALAKAVANDPRVERAFPDGRAWLELGPQADLFRLLGQALADFGAPADDLSDVPGRAARLRSVLDGRRYLLVLDDVWQAAHARPLLDAVQEPARALLTTRSRQVAADLQAANHEVWVLQPDAARAMLADASPEARQAVELDEAGARALAATLGFLPLALKVAGRRLARLARADGPAGAVARLQGEVATRLLALPAAEGRLGLAETESPLEAILALSYDALPDDGARQALRRLAVFGGQPLDYDAAAMQAVWQVDNEQALDLRLALVDAGLVETAQGSGATRYALHQVIAAFADARLALDPDEKRAAALLHAQHYDGVLGGYDNAISAGRMTYGAPLEWENVAIALERLAAASPADDAAAAILLDYARSWRNILFNNHDPRRVRWLAAAVAAARRVGEPWDLANVLKAQGDVLAFLDQRQEALAKYEEALGLFRAVGARLGEANVLQAQGDVLAFLDQRQEALAKYEEALGLFRAVGARLGEANVLLAQGDILRGQREFAPAWENYSRVRALYTAIGDRYSLARVLYRMGDWHAEQDQRQPAAELYRQAIDLWRSIGVDELVESILLPRLNAVL